MCAELMYDVMGEDQTSYIETILICNIDVVDYFYQECQLLTSNKHL